MNVKNRFWLFIALLTAFALRAYRLDAQSLWNDEGTSIALASLNLEAIVAGAARDIHPPLYYVLLSNWLMVSGNSEFAARFLSVIAGTLVVAFIFRIAYSVFDEKAGSVAAFLTAFSPLLIYYSQEARMYVLLPMWSALAALALFRISDCGLRISEEPISNPQSPISKTRRALVWGTFILANIAALYTHYFVVTLVLFENLAFGVWLLLAIRNSHSAIRNPKSEIVSWLIGQSVIGLAFLPWYIFAGNQLAAWPSISEPFDLPTLMWRVLNVFSVGLTLDGTLAAIVAGTFGILFVVGALGRMRELWGTRVLALWAIVPVAFMYVVSLARPAYNPKFLLLALPPFLILAARGVAEFKILDSKFRARILNLEFRISGLIALLALIIALPSLTNLYHNPRYARDDYRAILSAINASARADDAILINAPGQADVVRYYNRRALALYPLPRMRPPDVAATRADVDAVLARVERLYAIYWAAEQSDPQRVIETKLAESAFPARDEWFGNVRLAVYGNPKSRGALQTLAARVGAEIVLQDYRVNTYHVRAGDLLTLTLYWRAEKTPETRYKVFAHLLGANGQIVAQRDAEPGANLKPTPTWHAGEMVADNYGIWLETGTPPGEYVLEVGMYRADDGARLPIRARDGADLGDRVLLGTVRVE